MADRPDHEKANRRKTEREILREQHEAVDVARRRLMADKGSTKKQRRAIYALQKELGLPVDTRGLDRAMAAARIASLKMQKLNRDQRVTR